MAASSDSTSTLGNQEENLSMDEMIDRLHAEMRRRSGQDTPTESFPENPRRDPNNPNQADDYDRHRIGNLDWCSCRCCVPMPTGMESICCAEIHNVQMLMDDLPCILQHPMVPQLCSSEEWARIFLFLSTGSRGINPSDRDRNRKYRKAIYRAFTGWVHGCLGKGHRRPIPSCVVNKVREAFPDPTGHYMGFRPFGDIAAEYLAMED